MGEVLKVNFLSYLGIAILMAVCFFFATWAILNKVKAIENKTVKTILRVSVTSVSVCFWAWLFVWKQLCPIALAYYEYSNNLDTETTGVIQNIAQEEKDRIYVTIDDTVYTFVDSNEPIVEFGKNIGKGDAVIIQFGEKSKFIFDIIKAGEENT